MMMMYEMVVVLIAAMIVALERSRSRLRSLV